MGGGLLQLVAFGSQDVYLSGNPQITFFKVVYRRHTNFAMESIEQTFNGTVDWGRRVTSTISRNGDLLTKMYLRVVLPRIECGDDGTGTAPAAVRWVDYVGHKLIKFVEIEIGGQRIDKHYGEWLHIWNELTQSAGHSLGYNRLVGQHPSLQAPMPTGVAGEYYLPATTLYVPMQFWFNRNPGLALPLIALQYHEVKFNVEFADLDEVLVNKQLATNAQSSGLSASLFVDYIYLDADERKRFAQVTHEYLIEQLQFTGAESIGAGATTHKCKLSFNHPVKELIWTVRDDKRAADLPSSPFSYGTGPVPLIGGKASAMPNSDGEAFLDLFYGDKNPVKTALLQLNGHDRFSRRDGLYFNAVQPLQHHENVPSTGINVYSFALKPEEHQPSGSCNMSRIDNAVLQLELEKLVDGAQVSVYAVNYNVLRVLSGMGGLAYASIVRTLCMDSGGVASFGEKMLSLIFTGFTHSFGR